MRAEMYRRMLRLRPHQWGATGRFYRKSLILILLITSLPTALIGLTLYYFGISRMEEEVNRVHRIQVNQAIRTMDSTFSQLEVMTAQWAFNPIFDDNLKNYPFSYDFEKTQDLYKSLSVMRGSNPLIERVYMYLTDSDLLISNEDGIESVASGPSESAYRQLLQMPKSIFWTDALPSPGGEPRKVALVHKLPRGNGSPIGALIVYVDQTKLNRTMQEMNAENQVASLVLKEDGEPLFSMSGGGSGPPALQEALRKEAMSHSLPSQSHIYQWDDREYSISYGRFMRTGSTWTYVTATPIDQLTKPVAFLSRLITLLSALGLLSAFVLSWVASKQIYRPIQRLTQIFSMERDAVFAGGSRDEIEYIEMQWRHINMKTDQLEKRLQLQLPYLREGFLLQLLQGHLYSLSEEQLRERMKQFGLEIRHDGFAVIIVRLLGLSCSGNFKEGDEQLVTFSAANIIGDLLKQREAYQADVINFQDLTVGLLLTFPLEKPAKQVQQELYELSEKLSEALQSWLRMETAVIIGKPSADVKSIPAAFEEARQALKYRNMQKSSQIIEMEYVLPQGDKKIFYPFELESLIIQSIRMGDEEESLQRIEQFIGVLEEKAGQEILIQQSMIQLVGSIQHFFLKSGFHLPALAEGPTGFEQLFQLREPAEMVRWLRTNVIQPYAAEMTGWRESNDRQLQQAVDQVLSLLPEQFMEDVSLESYADQLRMNPYTLSKAFKQIKGVNFIDFLTDLRMDKSRQLLAETDMKINDVAKQVGYQPSYFNRIFKKHEGQTPSQYRSNLRQQTV